MVRKTHEPETYEEMVEQYPSTHDVEASPLTYTEEQAMTTVSQGGGITPIKGPSASGFFPDDRDEDGSLGMAPEEIRPPLLQFSGKTGKFNLSIYPEDELDDFSGVILSRMTDTRVRWDADELGRVTCSSKDNWQPDNAEQAISIGANPASCALCRFSRFGRDEDGNPTRPECTRYVNLAIGSVEEDPIPYLFSAKSTSISLIDRLLQVIELRRRKERRKGYSYVIRFGRGEHVKKGKADYFMLDAKLDPTPTPDGLMPHYSLLWHMMRGQPIDVVGIQMESGQANGETE